MSNCNTVFNFQYNRVVFNETKFQPYVLIFTIFIIGHKSYLFSYKMSNTFRKNKISIWCNFLKVQPTDKPGIYGILK